MVIIYDKFVLLNDIKTLIMSNRDTLSGCALVIVVILAIVISGTLAWNTVSPDNFGEGIFFILLWGLYGYIAKIVFGFIAMAVMSFFER